MDRVVRVYSLCGVVWYRTLKEHINDTWNPKHWCSFSNYFCMNTLSFGVNILTALSFWMFPGSQVTLSFYLTVCAWQLVHRPTYPSCFIRNASMWLRLSPEYISVHLCCSVLLLMSDQFRWLSNYFGCYLLVWKRRSSNFAVAARPFTEIVVYMSPQFPYKRHSMPLINT